MTTFDFIVLIVLAVTAIGGFMRGFVQEILSLGAWILAAFAIYQLHSPMSDWLWDYIGNTQIASIIAFVMLLMIPYAGMKLIAGQIGENLRSSVLGPIDRALGFGFGAVKGTIIVVMAFSLLALGYDSVWGVAGRPTWMTTAQTYPFIETASDSMVKVISDRRARLDRDQAE